MKNLKHSIAGITAVAMISSLAAVQASNINVNNKEKKLNDGPAAERVTIAVEDINSEQAIAVAQTVAAPLADDSKSYFQLGYVVLSSGTLDAHELPSYDSTVTGSLNACDQVEIVGATEDWYRVHCGSVLGYVPKGNISINRGDADYAAMQYDNYKKAVVAVSDSVRVREKPSTDSNILDELAGGTPVVLLWTEGNFIRVAYGEDYTEGYIIDTALSLTGEWLSKTVLSDRQKEVAKKAAEEREAAEKAKAAEKKSSGAYYGGSSSASTKGAAIVNTAMNYLGVPYVWGGTSPSGFDCSGLVQYVCSANGISVARVAAAQRGCGQYVSRENLQPGDLVFFDSGSGISHVGIYVGNGNMIHAPHSGDVVKISSINTDYRISQYAGAVRVY